MPKLTTAPRFPLPPTDPGLSLVEGAALHGVHPKTLRRWISEGTLPAYRVGRQIRVKLSDLNALVEQV